MNAVRIAGNTRIVGMDQHYQPLVVRDEEQYVNPLLCTNVMVTEWKPSAEELEHLKNGKHVFLMIAGVQHPPVKIIVGEPSE